MEKPISDEYYEEDFEFPLWKLIKQRAEEKDISYLKASQEVSPEYSKGIRIKDEAYEDELVIARVKYLEELRKKQDEV
jgi:hypothetical protein